MTTIHIFNMALGWLGTRTIASEQEKTPEAIQCALYWDSARRQALRDYPWNFAQRRAWLAEMSVPDGYEQEFKYAYALPQNCVKALEVRAAGDKKTRFIVIAGRVLLTNANKALLCYTADIHSAGDFDDAFAHAISRKLAALISVPILKNNRSKLEELEQLYRAALPLAMEADAGEGEAAEQQDSWLQARGL